MTTNGNSASPPRETFLHRFETNWKAATAVFALLGMGAGITGWLGLSAASTKNAAQDAAIVELDKENELLFQNDVRTAEGLKHMHEEIKAQRQDYRDVLTGVRLRPIHDHELGIDAEIPVPSPHPTVTP